MTGVNFKRNTRKETAMFSRSFQTITATLKCALKLNKTRANYFAAFIITAAEAKSITFGDVVQRLTGKARGNT